MARPATKDEFLEKHFHEVFGIVCDAATNRKSGGELSLWMTAMKVRIHDKLRAAWDDARASAEPEKQDSKETIPIKPQRTA